MDEKELRKFNYEFIKENNPDLNFVQCTDALINWVSNIPNKSNYYFFFFFLKKSTPPPN